MKSITINLSEINQDRLIRFNCKTLLLRNEINQNAHKYPLRVRISDLFYIVCGFAFSSGDYVEEGIPLVRIGDLNSNSVQNGMVFLPEDYLDEYANYVIKQNDILVSLTGDGKLKSAIAIEGEMLLNQRIGALRPKVNLNISFYKYLLQTDMVLTQYELFSNGKSQLNISPNDFLNIKIPIINEMVISDAMNKIAPIENAIQKAESRLQPIQSIIDSIFAREFGLDTATLYEISSRSAIIATIQELTINNMNFRNSTRWNKAVLIQEKMIKMSNTFVQLGKHIISTRNGYSPECNEASSETAVLGLDAINKDTVLNIDNPKFTDNIVSIDRDCYVTDGDFLISRGNTTELVALASIAHIDDDAAPIIFPDIMIRVDFDAEIDKQYMAYVFNSFIGRLYFKYATKGKNQTMVKTSSKEINDFYAPIPCLPEQRRIVGKIQAEINKLDEVKAKISDYRKKIDKIIETAICG